MTATIDGILTWADYPDRLLDKLCLYDSGLVASTVGMFHFAIFFD
jgi:hypothetical protein